MAHTTVLFGPPGTGKTTRLLEEMQTRMVRGLAPEEICFVSFSNNAVDEMVRRAGLSDAQRVWWSTIHSLGKRVLKLSRTDIASTTFRNAFLETLGERQHQSVFESEYETAEARFVGPASAMFSLHNIASARCLSLDDAYRQYAPTGEHPLELLRDLRAQWMRAKREARVFDFNDLLSVPLNLPYTLPVKLMVLDEAQDTSEAQMRLLRHLLPDDCEILVGGDDDQAIFDSLGASGGAGMHSWGGTREFLQQSYRLPRRVLRAARPVIQRVQDRVPKPLRARDADGDVREVSDLDELGLPSTGSVLILTRTRRELGHAYAWVRRHFVNFQERDGRWQHEHHYVRAALTYTELQRGRSVRAGDAERLRNFLPVAVPPLPHDAKEADPVWLSSLGAWTRAPWYDALVGMSERDRLWLRGTLAASHQRGEKFVAPGRVRVSTIHAAKGSEADHVILLDDIGSATRARIEASVPAFDSEVRVRYVGMTRAKESLTMVRGASPLL